MKRFFTFRSRVEQKIVLLVLGCAVLPLGLVAFVALHEIEEQTLALAQKQLRDSTKSYALEVFDRLDHAEQELRLLDLGVDPADALVDSFAVGDAEPGAMRRSLSMSDNVVRLGIPDDSRTLIGTIQLNRLFEDLGYLPDGMLRCLEAGGISHSCSGNALAEGYIESRWELPVGSVFDTDLQLAILSRQSRESALGRVSLVSRLLPLAVLLLTALIGWILIVLIRKRVAPLAELESATRAIQEGNYDTRIRINTRDEFQRLGDAFNLMTMRLSRSFEKMNNLAEIDRMILGGVKTEEVIEQGLLLAESYCERRCFVYLWQGHRKQGEIYQIESGVQQKTPLCLLPPKGVDRSRVDHRESLGSVLKIELDQGLPIRVDGATTGDVFMAASAEEDESAQTTLAELADRISVAATNTSKEQALYMQANYDVLTGLVNRQAFTDRVYEAIERSHRSSERGAVLFLDLDRFKQVNDSEGHLVGDELLRIIGQRLAAEVRGTDTVARLGGDEFAIIVSESGTNEDLAAMCRRIIEGVNEPIVVERLRHEVDVSVGVAVFPDDGTDAGSLLMKADVAMYQAKTQGGSTYAFYDRTLNDANDRRVLVESGLRSALTDRTLRLHFQPKLELSSMRIRGLEGLLRWQGEDGLQSDPCEFIPIAEETGLIHRFTELLLSESANCLELCRSEGLEVGRVAVNISTRQFSREGFARDLLSTLSRTTMAASDLEIEITESLFIQDAEHVRMELAALRAAGVHIALDDFGTGYSSLNMLRSLPLNTVKIDRSFIEPLRQSADARNVAQKIIEMAAALDLCVVAEGVEHWREISLLEQLGCHYVQGYALLAPAPVADLVRYLIRVNRDGVAGESRAVGLR